MRVVSFTWEDADHARATCPADGPFREPTSTSTYPLDHHSTMIRAIHISIRERQESIDLTDTALVTANQKQIIAPVQLKMLAEELSIEKNPLWGRYLFAIGLALIFIVVPIGIFQAYMAIVGRPLPLTGTMTLFYALPFALLVGGWIWEFFAEAGRRRLQQRVLVAGPYLIEQTQGEVVWDGENYHPHVPGVPLRAARMSKLLLPGPYHFFYERENKLLLSAQPILTTATMQPLPDTLSATGLSPDKQALQAIQSALFQVLGFTALDLETNRQGQLSTDQQKRWEQSSMRPDPDVQSIEGEVKVEARRSTEDTLIPDEYSYVIGGLSMSVRPSNGRAERVLVSGIRYRVYYINRSSLYLLSIEPLQAPGR